MNRFLCLAMAAWGLSILQIGGAWVHPAHVAIADAEWNRESGKLEVSLRVRPEDLEEALTRMQGGGQRINLETTPQVDRLLVAYLRPRVTLELQGRRQTLAWVGKEVDLRHAWLYFELDLPACRDARLSCTLLMDVLPDQANTVVVRGAGPPRSLTFTRQTPIQPLPLADDSE